MTTVILNIDGSNEKPQPNRRPNSRSKKPYRYPPQYTRPCGRRPQQEEQCGWAEKWGHENSTLNCRDPNFG